MKYHLTITDSDTGECVYDLDFDAMIAAVHREENGEDYVNGIVLLECGETALAKTIEGTRLIRKEVMGRFPGIALLA